MKKVAFLGIAIALAGCTQVTPVSEKTDQSVTDQVVYVHDARTELCFATISSIVAYGHEVVSITTVPCTPLVLAQARQ